MKMYFSYVKRMLLKARMEDGGWMMGNGEWRMVNGEWVNGEWVNGE